MIDEVICLYGTGDTYIICALMGAYAACHGRVPTLVVKGRHAAIPTWFGLPYRIDDELVRRGETDGDLHRSHPNDADPFFAHPHFARTPVRVDWLVARPNPSQADMYRAILGLPADAPLAHPSPPVVAPRAGLVLLITEAQSWANAPRSFWDALAARLAGDGWTVAFNDVTLPLSQLFERCADAEWVIGPQCGVTSILCAARFSCRKTFVIPPQAPGVPFPTFPYGYAERFTGEAYDVEHVPFDEHAVEAIATSANALRLPYDPAPALRVYAPLAVSDLLDRCAILEVKRRRFSPQKSAAVAEEHRRYRELASAPLASSAAMRALFEELIANHDENFMLMERVVPDVLAHRGLAVEDHAKTMFSNRDRARIKREIDALTHGSGEVKSYYG